MGVVDVRGRGQRGQRQPAAVGQDMNLAARLATVDRVWPGQLPLFSARTAIESTTARDQSMLASAPSRSNTAR